MQSGTHWSWIFWAPESPMHTEFLGNPHPVPSYRKMITMLFSTLLRPFWQIRYKRENKKTIRTSRALVCLPFQKAKILNSKAEKWQNWVETRNQWKDNDNRSNRSLISIEPPYSKEKSPAEKDNLTYQLLFSITMSLISDEAQQGLISHTIHWDTKLLFPWKVMRSLYTYIYIS